VEMQGGRQARRPSRSVGVVTVVIEGRSRLLILTVEWEDA
jgi:hypothetical protein